MSLSFSIVNLSLIYFSVLLQFFLFFVDSQLIWLVRFHCDLYDDDFQVLLQVYGLFWCALGSVIPFYDVCADALTAFMLVVFFSAFIMLFFSIFDFLCSVSSWTECCFSWCSSRYVPMCWNVFVNFNSSIDSFSLMSWLCRIRGCVYQMTLLYKA